MPAGRSATHDTPSPGPGQDGYTQRRTNTITHIMTWQRKGKWEKFTGALHEVCMMHGPDRTGHDGGETKKETHSFFFLLFILHLYLTEAGWRIKVSLSTRRAQAEGRGAVKKSSCVSRFSMLVGDEFFHHFAFLTERNVSITIPRNTFYCCTNFLMMLKMYGEAEIFFFFSSSILAS